MNQPTATQTASALEVTIVHASACHLCDDAEAALAELATRVPLRVAHVDATSEAGQRLLLAHRAGMLPLVLIDGRFFSSGRVPRGALHLVESDWSQARTSRPGEVS